MPTVDSARSWYPPSDPVHGFDHVLRVYHLAERLALAEGADLEIVRAAALLHDAEGRESRVESRDSSAISDQSSPPIINHKSTISNPRLAHHHTSASFAAHVLQAEGWPEERIALVQHCIRAHRFRDDREPPATLEAQVLFDADKLDAIGAIGVARAIGYAVGAGQPACAPVSQHFLETGQLSPGEPHSAYHEYIFKLRHIQERMFTRSGRQLAEARHRLMSDFFERLREEMEGQ